MSKRWLLAIMLFSLVFVVSCVVYFKFDRQQFDKEMSEFNVVANTQRETQKSAPISTTTQSVIVEGILTQTQDAEMETDTLENASGKVIDNVPLDHPLYGLTIDQAKAEVYALMAKIDKDAVVEMKSEIKALLSSIPDTTTHTMNHPVFDYARPLIEAGWSAEQLMNDSRFIQLSNDMLNQETGVDKVLKDSEERFRLSRERISESESLFGAASVNSGDD